MMANPNLNRKRLYKANAIELLIPIIPLAIECCQRFGERNCPFRFGYNSSEPHSLLRILQCVLQACQCLGFDLTDAFTG